MKYYLQHITDRISAFYKANKFAVWFFLLSWLTLSFVTVHKDVLYFSINDEESADIGLLYFRGFFLWTLAACFTPLILKLARLFPIDKKKHRKRNILLHLFFSICFLFVLTIIFAPVFNFMLPEEDSFEGHLLWTMYWYSLGMPVAYWFITGSFLLKQNAHLYDKRHRKAAALQSELKKIQLNVLQMQLRPHFLFNALNTVNALIFENNKAAENTLKKIRSYLSLSFTGTDKQEIPLGQELYFTGLYLDIEKERYSDRLRIEQQIEPGTEKALVPNMLLQPLAENAVRHGIAPQKGPGTLLIRARQKNDTLFLSIEDSGKGMDTTERIPEEGLGIKNTIERLDKLYNGNFRFEIDYSDLGGCKVSVQIPLKMKADTAKSEDPAKNIYT